MHLATVSVIIRTTHRSTLAAAIRSVEGQTHRPIELVLVDASGTGFPASALSAGGIRIVTSSCGKALGYGEAANAGLDLASGDYLVFLDDDDFFDPEHISCRLAALEGAEAVDGEKPLLAYGPTRHVGRDGVEKAVMNEEYSAVRLHHHNYIQIGAALFSRQLLARGCRFDAQFGALVDWDFWLQASLHTSFAYTPQVTNNWCADGGGSGAGVGQNFDTTGFHRLHDALMAKWRVRHLQLIAAFEQHADAAFAALQRGDLQQAERAYRDASRFDATDASMLGNMAFIRMQQGNVQDAVALLRRAIHHHPGYTDGRINLATLYAQTGNASDALALLDPVLASDPQYARAQVLRAKLAAIAQRA